MESFGMKHLQSSVVRVMLFALACIVVGCSGPTTPPPRSIQPIDKAVVAAAEMNLKTDAELAAAGITVKAENDLLILNGQVTNQAAKERAETIARKTRGVEKVANHLEVVPAPGQDPTAAVPGF